MIEVQTEVTCQVCGKPIRRVPGRRPRVYCKPSCRQKALRERKREQMAEHREADAAALSRVADLQARINGLERLLDHLRDLETTWVSDTGVHPFKRFLKASPSHASRAGCVKVLDPEYGFPPAGSRGSYTDAMRRATFTAEQQADVWAAWRDMLRDELFQSYYANRQQS